MPTSIIVIIIFSILVIAGALSIILRFKDEIDLFLIQIRCRMAAADRKRYLAKKEKNEALEKNTKKSEKEQIVKLTEVVNKTLEKIRPLSAKEEMLRDIENTLNAEAE